LFQSLEKAFGYFAEKFLIKRPHERRDTMKKTSFIISSVLILLSLVVVSGCSQHSNNLSGTEYYDDDMYKMVTKTKHEKCFPGEHVNKHEDVKEKRCYYEKDTPAYFCQYWEPWDE
jgi:hypothetical protein